MSKHSDLGVRVTHITNGRLIVLHTYVIFFDCGPWLLVYLTGASPVVCPTFVGDRHTRHLVPLLPPRPVINVEGPARVIVS